MSCRLQFLKFKPIKCLISWSWYYCLHDWFSFASGFELMINLKWWVILTCVFDCWRSFLLNGLYNDIINHNFTQGFLLIGCNFLWHHDFSYMFHCSSFWLDVCFDDIMFYCRSFWLDGWGWHHGAGDCWVPEGIPGQPEEVSCRPLLLHPPPHPRPHSSQLTQGLLNTFIWILQVLVFPFIVH